MLGHSLIRDDMHVASGTHPGVVIIPAMLALAEREKLSGKALVSGIVAGYQVMGALGTAVRTGLSNRHFRPLGISGAYGAAAGAVAALPMNEDMAVNALALAANFSCGLNQWPWSGGDGIFVHPGMAARNAVTAVDLARAGITASELILEGADGLFAAYGSGDDAARIFRERLGGPPEMLSVTHKPFAGCNYVQTPVAAALEIRRIIGTAKVKDIERIVISTFAAARSYPGCDNAGPFSSVQQTKMSLQYGVAAGLRFGALDESSYTHFADDEMNRLLSICEIRLEPRYEGCAPRTQPVRLEVQMQAGESVRHELDDVPWLGAQAVKTRFEREAITRLPTANVQEISGLLSNLWHVPDPSALFTVLGRTACNP